MQVHYMCFLAMSPFSHDYMKMEKYTIQSNSNVLTDLHVYRIHTAPEGRTSMLAKYWIFYRLLHCCPIENVWEIWPIKIDYGWPNVEIG